MAALLDIPFAESLQDSAAFLPGVAASHKTALAQEGRKLTERLRQAALQLQVQLRPVKGRKTWGIHHLRPTGEAVQLDMAGGVPPPSQGGADLSYL